MKPFLWAVPPKTARSWKSIFSSGMPPMKLVIIDTSHLIRVIIPAGAIPDMFVVIPHCCRSHFEVEMIKKSQIKHYRTVSTLQKRWKMASILPFFLLVWSRGISLLHGKSRDVSQSLISRHLIGGKMDPPVISTFVQSDVPAGTPAYSLIKHKWRHPHHPVLGNSSYSYNIVWTFYAIKKHINVIIVFS